MLSPILLCPLTHSPPPIARSDQVYGLEPLLFISFPPIDHPSERGAFLESITAQDVRSWCKDGLDKLVIIFSRGAAGLQNTSIFCGAFSNVDALFLSRSNSSFPNEREEKERKGESRSRGTRIIPRPLPRTDLRHRKISSLDGIYPLIYSAYILNSKHVLRDALNSRM